MHGCRFQGDAGAAQILLPSLLSSQHLKSRAITAIRLGQDQGTQGRSGQLRQGGLFRDIPERATSLLRWDACVTALSHVCFVTSSHGLGQQSWHAQSCHLAGLHHPHPATCRSGTFRDRCHSRPWLCRAYSRPDKALGGTPAPGVHEHGLTWAVPWKVPNQVVPAAVREQVTPLSGDWWGWNPALHPSTLCSLTHAQNSSGQSQYSWEPKRGEQCWDWGTELGHAIPCHHDCGGIGSRCCW